MKQIIVVFLATLSLVGSLFGQTTQEINAEIDSTLALQKRVQDMGIKTSEPPKAIDILWQYSDRKKLLANTTTGPVPVITKTINTLEDTKVINQAMEELANYRNQLRFSVVRSIENPKNSPTKEEVKNMIDSLEMEVNFYEYNIPEALKKTIQGSSQELPRLKSDYNKRWTREHPIIQKKVGLLIDSLEKVEFEISKLEKSLSPKLKTIQKEIKKNKKNFSLKFYKEVEKSFESCFDEINRFKRLYKLNERLIWRSGWYLNGCDDCGATKNL